MRGRIGGENLVRDGLDHGNKSTADRPSDEARIAIFPAISTSWRLKTIFPVRFCPPAHMEDEEMRQVRSLLSSASSRIGRRLSQIVAIAAASLPSAGA